MVVNITNEEFFGVTLTIFDKYGDYVRNNYVDGGQGGSKQYLDQAGPWLNS